MRKILKGQTPKEFKVNRDLQAGRYRLADVFYGLEQIETLKRYLGGLKGARKVIQETIVTLTNDTRYMHVNDENGELMVGLNYLRTGDERHVYLDVIHELVHVKQYLEGRALFDRSYSYVDRPTEIEAYRCGVMEGLRIGMSKAELADYLYVEWITREEHLRLLGNVGVRLARRNRKLR